MNRNQVTYGILAGLAMIGTAMFPAIAHEHSPLNTTLARRDPAPLLERTPVEGAPGREQERGSSEEQMRQMVAQCNSMMGMMGMMPTMMEDGDMPNMM